MPYLTAELLAQLESQTSLPPHLRTALEQSLTRLAELETNFAAALEREKLAALKELAYGASHELNNPLANISTRAQALMREEVHPERRSKLATIAAQAMRAHEMISDLMLFAKPPTLHVAQIDVSALVEQVVQECQGDAQAQSTSLVVNCLSEPMALQADGTQLLVALKALVRNALEALASGGTIAISAAVHLGQCCLAVQDTGPGISPETRKHLFDPFHSGREAGRGLGFGLAKCWRIAEMHGGRLEVASELGQGAKFTLLLPLQTLSAAPAAR